jgi:hypothetical protein
MGGLVIFLGLKKLEQWVFWPKITKNVQLGKK